MPPGLNGVPADTATRIWAGVPTLRGRFRSMRSFDGTALPLRPAPASPHRTGSSPLPPRRIGTRLRTIRNPAPLDKEGFGDPAVEW